MEKLRQCNLVGGVMTPPYVSVRNYFSAAS